MSEGLLLVGLGPTTLSALESLAERFTLLGLARPAAVPGADEALERAAELGVPVFHDVAPAAIGALIGRLGPRCVVISSYNRIVGPGLLGLAPFVNVHYAPLPQYRGRANVNWAIVNGEAEAAISIHTVAPGLDAGNILFQRRIPIGPHDTATSLYAALNALQREHLGAVVEGWLAGDDGEPQREEEATYGCTRVPADGEIDWAAPTARIYALVRALAPPYPGAFTFLEGRPLVIREARPLDPAPVYVGRVPGRVIGRSHAEGSVDVLTGDGVLRLLTVERAGEPPAPAARLITSTKQTLGLRAADLLARIAALEAELASLRDGRAVL